MSLRKMSRSAHIFFWLGAVLFGTAYSLSANMLRFDEVKLRLGELLSAFALALAVLYGLYCLAALLGKRTGGMSSRRSILGKQAWIKAFAVLVLVYGLFFLAYFPGPATNDSLMIYRNGFMMANVAPMVYCVFIAVFAKIGQLFGSATLGTALCNLTQMLIVCGVSAWIVCWIDKKTLPLWAKLAVFLYYLVNPLLIIYSFCMIKDTLFSVGIAALFLLGYDALFDRDNVRLGQWALVAAVALFITAFRNGVIKLAIVYVFFLLFVMRGKKGVIKPALLLLAGILCVSAASKALEKWQNVEYYSKEMLAIPIQQLSAAVACDGNLTEEQKEVIGGMMALEDIRNKYVCHNVDAIKWDMGFDNDYVNDNMPNILKVWIEAFPENKEIYLKAYLWETFWYWAPVQQGTVKIFKTVVDLDPAWHAETGLVDAPKLPEQIVAPLRGYAELSEHFLREGLLFWLMLLFMLELYALSGKAKSFLVYVICLLPWAVLMASAPVNQSVRYVMCFVYALPAAFAMLFDKKICITEKE